MKKQNIKFQIRFSEKQKEKYQKIANYYNLNLSSWIRLVLDKEVRKEEEKN